MPFNHITVYTKRAFTSRGTATKDVVRKTLNNIALIELHRPKQLNALNTNIIHQLIEELESIEKDGTIKVAILTGGGKAFAAGADISEMAQLTFENCLQTNFLENWKTIAAFTKPLIAAINGYAFGGGLELALMCDILYASKSAKLGQPEIKLGTIPGGGGTQRLTKLVGKYKAMELVLSGDPISADQAKIIGLINEVFEDEDLIQKTIEMAEKISRYPLSALLLAKKSINAALDMNLSDGLKFETQIFHSTFSLDSQKEGMAAFIEKREPKY